MNATQETLADFVTRTQTRMSATRLPIRLDQNTDDTDTWGKGASHWLCQFTQEGRGHNRTFHVQYSTGYALKSAPKCVDVLGSCISDATCADGTFEDFCDDLGYDSDSRRAERTYNACRNTAKKLRAFFSRADFAAAIAAEQP